MLLFISSSGLEINAVGIFFLGLAAGFASGLFGVGGGFLLVPLFNIIFNVPYNVAIGSSLGVICGTSISGVIKHTKLGNVDFKLGWIMLGGGIIGVEIGTRLIEIFKDMKYIIIGKKEIAALDLFIPIIFIALLCFIGTFMYRESKKARQEKNGDTASVKSDFIKKIQALKIAPVINLPVSGTNNISFWVILLIGFSAGVLSGLLGIGGGFIMMPALIYVVGIPTPAAIGTCLFQMIFSSGFGCFSHSLKGNVDIVLVALVLTGSIIGAQLGASTVAKVRAVNIRYAFSFILFLAAYSVLIKLLLKLGVG